MRLKAAVAAAETQSATDLKNLATKQTSGTITTKQLRRMRHPFARRDPQTPLNPAVVNKQSGQLRAGWRILPIKASRTGTRTGVTNASVHAKLVKRAGSGKSKSVARPLVAAIFRKIRPERTARLRAALRKVIKETNL